jgi:hypothetical protein
MTTFFDVITVTCFAGLVLPFFQFTAQGTGTLIRFLLVGIVFAVANQLGNAGGVAFALVLIAAGIGYAVLVARSADKK